MLGSFLISGLQDLMCNVKFKSSKSSNVAVVPSFAFHFATNLFANFSESSDFSERILEVLINILFRYFHRVMFRRKNEWMI